MTDKHDDLTDLHKEIIQAYKENSLPAMAFNCIRGEKEAETHACIIELHNKGAIDVIKAFSQLKKLWGTRFFFPCLSGCCTQPPVVVLPIVMAA